MGLFYLQTLYWFVRWTEPAISPRSPSQSPGPSAPDRRGGFAILSLLACAAGMATKEVMVSAPCTVLLLDRLCFAGSFSKALARRRWYYAGLASTWVLLAALVWRAGSRGGTSGIGSDVSVWKYWATQPAAILRYVRLAVWPHPLIFDYGTEWLSRPGEAIGVAAFALRLAAPLLALGGLLAFALFGVARNRPTGLLVFWFLAILAPTSLIPGNRQTAAEHRMYLALIPFLVAVVAAVGSTRAAKSVLSRPAFALLVGGWALALAATTFARNRDYQSALALFGHDAEWMPGNGYAQTNYGTALLIAKRYPEAEQHLVAALQLQPGLTDTEDNLGNLYLALGRYEAAETHYRRALQIDPDSARAHDNLAQALLQLDRVSEARQEVDAALRLKPDLAAAHDHLGLVLLRENRLSDALAELRLATSLDPVGADAWINLGNALRAAGQPDRAAQAYDRAARLEPDNGSAQYDWGGVLLDLHRYAAAEFHLRLAIRLQPDNPSAHQNLANALLDQDRIADALSEYETAIRLAPEHAAAHYNYGNGLLRAGRQSEAVREFQAALRIDPGFEYARQMLARLAASESGE